VWLDHYDARAGSGGVDVCGGPTPERRMRIPVTATVPHNARCALSHFPRTHHYTTSSTQSRSDALLHPLTVPSTSASAARFSPRRVAPAVRPRGLWTMWKYTRDDARAAGKRNGTRAARNSEMSPSCPPTCEVVYISGHAGYEDSLKALTLFLTLRRSRRRHTHTFVELCEEQDEDQAVLPSIMHVRPREAPQASERALAGAHVQIKG